MLVYAYCYHLSSSAGARNLLASTGKTVHGVCVEQKTSSMYQGMKAGFWAVSTDSRSCVNTMPWEELFTHWPEPATQSVDPTLLKRLALAEQMASKVSYYGGSKCRLCKMANGGEEYTLGGWTWPSGYRHYLVDHNVHPTPEFAAFLRALEFSTTETGCGNGS
jgi:hypothetical protein